jgi:hypothetical protein
MATKKIMCDINKNVAKMGVIIKGVYCSIHTKHVWEQAQLVSTKILCMSCARSFVFLWQIGKNWQKN